VARFFYSSVPSKVRPNPLLMKRQYEHVIIVRVVRTYGLLVCVKKINSKSYDR